MSLLSSIAATVSNCDADCSGGYSDSSMPALADCVRKICRLSTSGSPTVDGDPIAGDVSRSTHSTEWTYPDLTDTLGLDLHFAAEVNSAVAGMAALALLCISFSKLMGDF